MLTNRQPQQRTLFPYTTLFRSDVQAKIDAPSTTQATQPTQPTDDGKELLAREIASRADDPRGATPPPPATQAADGVGATRSEEHTSELQSQSNLVCRLLLEKKK